MQNDERLSGALQENVLTVLCFDEKYATLVRAAVTPRTFESAVFREVAGAAIDYLDQFGVPVKEHLPDHLEHVLEGDDKRKADSYRRLLDNLFASRETVNAEYVISQLHKFVRQQNLKSSVLRAVEALEDGRVDDAEVELQKGMNTQATVFSGGFALDNPDDVAGVLDEPEEEGFDLGIPGLDEGGVIPRRKELLLFVAPRGRGKSWFVTHCAKMALVHKWSVLVVTLEMSERRYAARFLQAFFSIGKREAITRVTKFSKDRDGELSGLVQEKIERETLRDDGIKAKLVARAKREFKKRAKLRIKGFPSGSMTFAMLEAYLDGLERFEKWTPDLICLDYPDLMDLQEDDLRIGLGKVTVKLRGLADRRNAAVVAVSQGNRESETATTVTGGMVAEDISKLATADNMLTYSQTPAEYALGLARIFVEKARNEAAKFSVLISQAYAIGQFCLDSIALSGEYWEMLDVKGGRGRRRREDDDEDDDNRPARDERQGSARGRRRG